MNKFRIFFSIALIVALLAIGVSCGESKPTGGTLRIIWSTGPGPGWGWGPSIFGGEAAYADMAMEGLMESKFLGGEWVPRLAKDYDISDDGKTITFDLRKGVKFHDGTDFNADAVKYTHDAMIETGRHPANVLSCEVVDDYTVKFNFAEGLNINLTAVANTLIASPTHVKAVGPEEATFNAVGTGPFKQVSYEPGTKIRLERYDDYWGEKALLDAIEGTFITDPVTLVMAMQAGQGDMTHSRDAKTMADLRDAGFNVNQNYMGMEAMFFNSRDADSPFRDVRVRQAFEHAINKEGIVNALGYGYWQVADQFQIPGMTGYLDDIEPRTYNPDKARELLAEAAADGVFTPNELGGFDTVINHGVWDFNDGIQTMQADLLDVGIRTEINSFEFGTWATTRQEGWDGVFIAGSGMTSNFNSSLNIYFGSADLTEMYSIARLPEVLEAAQLALRAIPADDALTEAAARLIWNLCLWASIQHHGDNFAYNDKVNGLNNGTYGNWGAFDAEKIWLSEE